MEYCLVFTSHFFVHMLVSNEWKCAEKEEKCTQRERHTQSVIHIYTHRQTQTQTDRRTDRHTHRETHTQSHTQRNTHTDTHSRTLTHRRERGRRFHNLFSHDKSQIIIYSGNWCELPSCHWLVQGSTVGLHNGPDFCQKPCQNLDQKLRTWIRTWIRTWMRLPGGVKQ